MRDFADLESAVQNKDSRTYLHEAIVALNSEANRAAIVTLWTAIMLDLIGKVRHLANSGDNDAEHIVQAIDHAIDSNDVRNMQNIEFGLLTNAEKLEIITPRQKKVLERIREDRNLCAHPAFIAKGEVYKPSIELVRSHIASAVDCCLSLPTNTGKQVIQLFEDDLASDAWPDVNDVPSFVRHRYLENVRESTKRNVTKLAIKYAMMPYLAEAAAFVEPNVITYRCRCYINSLALLDRKLLATCLSSVLENRRKSNALSDELLIRSLGAFGYLREYWEFLREDEVIALDKLLRICSAEMLVDLEVFASGVPTNERIATACELAFSKVSQLSFGGIDKVLTSATYGKKSLVPLAIADLKTANSYRIAEQKLGRLATLAAYLSPEDIREAGQVIRSNDQIYEAAGAKALLMNIFEATKSVPDAMEAWGELATGLNCDYLARHPGDPDGYYSYSELLTAVRESD